MTTPFNCDAESNSASLPEESEIPTATDGGLGFVDFTLWVHIGNPDPIFEDHTPENAAQFAREVGVRTYALDDASALAVDGTDVTVLSEGRCEIFEPAG